VTALAPFLKAKMVRPSVNETIRTARSMHSPAFVQYRSAPVAGSVVRISRFPPRGSAESLRLRTPRSSNSRTSRKRSEVAGVRATTNFPR